MIAFPIASNSGILNQIIQNIELILENLGLQFEDLEVDENIQDVPLCNLYDHGEELIEEIGDCKTCEAAFTVAVAFRDIEIKSARQKRASWSETIKSNITAGSLNTGVLLVLRPVIEVDKGKTEIEDNHPVSRVEVSLSVRYET